MSGWLRVLLLIIPYFIITGIFQLIGMLILGIELNDIYPSTTSFQDLIISFFNLIGTVVALWLFMTYIDLEKFINLGFEIKNRVKDFLFGFLIGFLILGLGFLILIYSNEIYFISINYNLSELIISILFFFVVALVEEMLFRGYVLRNLMFSFNKYIAIIISSLLFSLMHGFNPNIDLVGFIDLFIAGVLLGMSYIYTKNLWFPIALHFGWNLFQTLLGFNVSGQDFYSLIEFSIFDKNLLNGGDFGFEGSIYSLVFQVIFIIVIWKYYTKLG